ncbi:hypothetical protein GCM10025856_25110 [Methylophaga marina]|uniref:Uncharacterized protein n=1 Tax=Methylophaga marina TaxID=45495 RepID=A0ABN0U009_9GAMM|nr:hypothetical protein [Methylophaga marina]BDZ74792.1 hypothetical protein GCM10025856_25110 [Methylophaga marina]
MIRLPRLFKKDCPQYLIQRDNFHQAVFFSDEDDSVYLVKLKDFPERFEVKIHPIKIKHSDRIGS